MSRLPKGPFVILVRKLKRGAAMDISPVKDGTEEGGYWELWREGIESGGVACEMINANKGKGITAWWWWGPAGEAQRLIEGKKVKNKRWTP
jgi:hypothetical protein